ncbi:MAG: ECF-type sigma factor [Planctomycetota bacterium]|jgi:RNA polymerase sigma factor (TIGR02999 family)
MAGGSAGQVTHLLADIRGGRRDAAAELMAAVYEELRALAHHQMAAVPPGDTLQATALVHEAYLRLVGREQHVDWESRGHFFNAAARAMRDILVEQARRHASLKRGGDRKRVEFRERLVAAGSPEDDLLALDEALCELEQRDETSAKVVMLRHFAGLTVEETARALGLSTPTVNRRWRYARAWLHGRVYGSDGVNPEADDAQ